EAHKDDDGHAWTSARLTTRGKVTFRYGKIELRARVPAGRGNWAAGWTLGDAYVDELSWPYCGEIDILESVGFEVDNANGDGKAHASVHCRAFYFKEDSHHTSTLPVKDMHNSFHTYAVEWTPGGITAFVDDQPYFAYDDTTDERTWPFDEPQNIILNLAMGGGWGGAQGMDPQMTSQQYILDYVRVYARK
ncbi:MAG: glycoside hydrolase family 16 protein, partial [Saprospiraceae bacterium]|nr:glycoside hydrolase family 16 protein [Saprospiraceae bacterium]